MSSIDRSLQEQAEAQIARLNALLAELLAKPRPQDQDRIWEQIMAVAGQRCHRKAA